MVNNDNKALCVLYDSSLTSKQLSLARSFFLFVLSTLLKLKGVQAETGGLEALV